MQQIYNSLNLFLLGHLPRQIDRFLDLGCGAGSLGARVRAQGAREVVGVNYDEVESNIAREALHRVEIRDLDRDDITDLGQFDLIACSHVLEHLKHPEKVLAQARSMLTPGGRLLVVLPNPLYWRNRYEFMAGRFRYEEFGIMDRTHLRFYDWQAAHELLQGHGFKVVYSEAQGAFPLSRKLPRALSKPLDRRALAAAPGLFGWQFLLSCEAA